MILRVNFMSNCNNYLLCRFLECFQFLVRFMLYFIYTAIQWLISASAQLHSNNQYINVSCNTTLSAPEAKCLATLNCTNCDEVTTKVFTGHTLLSVIAGSDYHISVQAIRSDNIVPLEEYSIVETLSVPQPSPEPTVAQQPLVTDQLQSAKLPQSTEHLQLTGKPRSTVMPQPTKYPGSGTFCMLLYL